MTFSISRPEPGARLGADQCPGTGQRGHGLTMAVIHDPGCCQEWETGQASTPARAESFRQAAARWGMTWPDSAPARPAPNPGRTRAGSRGQCRPEAGDGPKGSTTRRPRPFRQPPEGELPMTADRTTLPTRADLDAATARTAAVLADPAATRAERVHAAEMEQAVHLRYLQRPGADAELQAEAELEAGT